MLFGIIGGDRRQEELLALLRRDGYTVAACGVAGEMDWDAAVAAEVVILPLPLCKEGDTLNIEGPRRGAGALFRQQEPPISPLEFPMSGDPNYFLMR